jgi:hypothetical protein
LITSQSDDFADLAVVKGDQDGSNGRKSDPGVMFSPATRTSGERPGFQLTFFRHGRTATRRSSIRWLSDGLANPTTPCIAAARFIPG